MTRTCHILIVDDNVDACDTLAILLREQGHVTRCVTDPFAASSAAREFKPEIVFLDLGMPGLDGLELGSRLRKEFGDRIFLVALTGHGDREYRTKTAKAGFDAHIVKPADYGLIKATIEEACESAPRRA
ncbi:MAG TPA: response regulator [Burkholderiales bacterium]|nr:response regulator [Burkholderiales bacterium]